MNRSTRKSKPAAVKKPARKATSSAKNPARARANGTNTAAIPEQVDPFIRREERYVPDTAVMPGPTGVPAQEPARQLELPRGYGDNLIHLLVRDPYMLYSYWEIRGDVEQDALGRLGGNRADVKSILRVYDISDATARPAFFDITLMNMADDWYIQVGANRSYVVEIGLLHRDGRFIALARSNRVTTPRDGMSEVLDEHWMGIDFDKVYALSGGFQVGLSSAELSGLMRERLAGAITSGSGAGGLSSLSSPIRPAQRKRKFWFILDCELIVTGATEPDATVTINGSPIRLRPDGTFTLRYALPDGRVHVDARAHSADGVEERAIIPDVVRSTQRPDPVFKKPFDTNVGANGSKG